MRIVYVSADRGIPVLGDKGASVHIREMMRAFAALGHEIRAVTARRGDGEAHCLWVEEVAQSPNGPERADKERAAMAQAKAIEARLLALYRDWPFDLIYERYSLWSAAGCRAGAALGVPVVTEVNAPLILEQETFRSLVCAAEARAIEAEVFATSTALAAVSRQVGAYLTGAGAPRDRVHVIGNAVDTDQFCPGVPPARIPGVPEDAFVVGFTGSLKRWHGVDVLLEAFRRFRASEPRARLLICGDGPKRGWIEGFVAGADLGDAVILTGWVDHARLPSLIARMDVATAPYPASDGALLLAAETLRVPGDGAPHPRQRDRPDRRSCSAGRTPPGSCRPAMPGRWRRPWPPSPPTPPAGRDVAGGGARRGEAQLDPERPDGGPDRRRRGRRRMSRRSVDPARSDGSSAGWGHSWDRTAGASSSAVSP